MSDEGFDGVPNLPLPDVTTVGPCRAVCLAKIGTKASDLETKNIFSLCLVPCTLTHISFPPLCDPQDAAATSTVAGSPSHRAGERAACLVCFCRGLLLGSEFFPAGMDRNVRESLCSLFSRQAPREMPRALLRAHTHIAGGTSQSSQCWLTPCFDSFLVQEEEVCSCSAPMGDLDHL